MINLLFLTNQSIKKKLKYFAFLWVWNVPFVFIRVATKLSRQNSMTIPWLFHDRNTKFHDLLITIHVAWTLKSCRVAAAIRENKEFVCKIPRLFHDFYLQFKNSMTFPWPCPFLVQIPWLFQKFQKIHDFSMTVATLLNPLTQIEFDPLPPDSYSVFDSPAARFLFSTDPPPPGGLPRPGIFNGTAFTYYTPKLVKCL